MCMSKGCTRLTVLLPAAALLSACSPGSPAPQRARTGFFERDSVGGARCYAGSSIARGGEERVQRDSSWDRTVYLVLDTVQWEGERRSAHVIGASQPLDHTGAAWVVAGDSLLIEEWGVMPSVSYVVHEDGEALAGRAWMTHDAISCFGGVCEEERTSRWAVRARRIPCTDVPREPAPIDGLLPE